MKKLLLAGVMSLATLPAYAEQLMQSGYWSTYVTQATDPQIAGTNLCGLETRFGNDWNNPTGAVIVKYFQGYPGLAVHLFQHQTGVYGKNQVPIRMYLDQTLVANVMADGEPAQGMENVAILQFGISANKAMSFLGQLADSDWMQITFDDKGTYWTASLKGSRDAVQSFQNCMASLNNPPVASAPSVEVPKPDFSVKYPTPTPAPTGRDTVPLVVNGGDIRVDVGIGGATVRMILDTGASSMVINSDLAEQLVKTGEAVWGDDTKASMADGSIVKTKGIVIKMVRIGNHIIHFVYAMVKPNGDMLLGLDILNEMGKFSIDAKAGVLEFGS